LSEEPSRVQRSKRLIFLLAGLMLIACCVGAGLLANLMGYTNSPSRFQPSGCPDLFRLDVTPDADDSIPPDKHVPAEARPVMTPSPTWTPQAPPAACARGLPVLPTEVVLEQANTWISDFSLSPSGLQMALATEDGIYALDLRSGTRRQVAPAAKDAWYYLRFWAGEDWLFIDQYKNAAGGKGRTFRLDIRSGRQTDYDERWQFDRVGEEQFDQRFYTGWQAAEALDVSAEQVCQAVRKGWLSTVLAADGSWLLPRETLLDKGANVVRVAYPQMLPSTDATALRQPTSDVRAIFADTRAAPPNTHGFWYWPYVLVLTGRSSSPQNVLLYVNTPEQWAGSAVVPNEVQLWVGMSEKRADAHPDFAVALDPCPNADAEDQRYVLYRKGHAGGSAVPIGYLPYAAWDDLRSPSPQRRFSWMVWSPDRAYIYLWRESVSEYSISRVRLPEQ
jgi:hypothetical protein